MAEPSPDCSCCPHLHEAVELIGRRWTGAIIEVLRHDGSLRFSAIVSAIPGLSDRLCSERMKERVRRPAIPSRSFSGVTAVQPHRRQQVPSVSP